MISEIESNSLDLETNNLKWAFCTARYVVCILTIVGVKTAAVLLYDVVRKQRDLDSRLLAKVDRHKLLVYMVSLAILYCSGQKLYADDFHLLMAAYLIIKFPEIGNRLNLTCGVTMACGYVEGYLDILIPSDGGDNLGLLGNFETFEANQRVVFPVKKLFIIITKSMYSPPDLKEFNVKIDRRDLAWLEGCSSLDEVVRHVAGVRNRLYANSVYKINRSGKRPVYVAAECVASLTNFYKVMKNTIVTEELTNVYMEDIVADFFKMLKIIVRKSPQLNDKIELIYFDDAKGLNLADVLLERIEDLVPNFEEVIARRD